MDDTARQRESLLEWKADMPKEACLMSAAEKEAELAGIKQEINSLYSDIRKAEDKAAKVLHNAVFHAKRIGDLLARAKDLLPHGKYEPWVEANFDGGSSTARGYKWIATHPQWQQLEPLLHTGSMSLRQAIAILSSTGDDEDEQPPDVRQKAAMKALTLQFNRLLSGWPAHVVMRLAEDLHFMELVKQAAKERNKEIVKAAKA